MIYDCFTFFNELELLDIRLHELNSVVDKFVLVEGMVTFTNRKKPLYFEKNKHLFKKFEKKIIYVPVKDSPSSSDPWEIERFQFNAIGRGLKSAKDNDIILLSCVDEIPKAEKVRKWSEKDPTKIKVFLQKLSYYFLNLTANSIAWEGTKLLVKKQIKTYKDLYEIRQKQGPIEIKNGGWHFSYMGGVKKIQNKIEAFSHQEFNKNIFTSDENVQNALLNRRDLFNRKIDFTPIYYNKLPLYVQENQGKFLNFLIPEPKNIFDKLFIK